MNDLLVSLLVPALAIAINPIPIIAAVTLLMSDHGRRNTAAFLGCLILVMAADGLITLFLIGQDSSSSSQANGGIQLVFGLVFLALFLLQWRSKPVALGEEPGWMKMMNKAGFGAAVVLGLALTNYALLSAGISTIRKAEVDTTAELQALAFFILVSVSTVAATLILFLVRPRWAQVQLARLKIWLTRHSRTILLAVFGLMGALFTVQGLVALLN